MLFLPHALTSTREARCRVAHGPTSARYLRCSKRRGAICITVQISSVLRNSSVLCNGINYRSGLGPTSTEESRRRLRDLACTLQLADLTFAHRDKKRRRWSFLDISLVDIRSVYLTAAVRPMSIQSRCDCSGRSTRLWLATSDTPAACDGGTFTELAGVSSSLARLNLSARSNSPPPGDQIPERPSLE